MSQLNNEIYSFLKTRGYSPPDSLINVKKTSLFESFLFTSDEMKYLLTVSTEEKGKRNRYFYDNFRDSTTPATPLIITGCSESGKHISLYALPHGCLCSTLSLPELEPLIPSIQNTLFEIHLTPLPFSVGYGPLNQNGAGEHCDWKSYLSEWLQRLDFSNISVPEKDKYYNPDIFTKAYDVVFRMIEKYSSESKQLLHGLFNPSQLIIENGLVIDIINWHDCRYGDYLFDVASLELATPLCTSMRAIYAEKGFDIENYNQRLTCYKLLILLDDLYNSILNENIIYRNRIAHTLENLLLTSTVETAPLINLLKKKDESTDVDWQMRCSFNASATLNRSQDKTYHINIKNSGKKASDICLIHKNIDVKQGTIYRVSFDAFSDDDREISLVLRQRQQPFTVYSTAHVEIGTEQKRCSCLLAMAYKNDPMAVLTFLFGGNDNKLSISNIAMHVEEVPSIVFIQQPKDSVNADEEHEIVWLTNTPVESVNIFYTLDNAFSWKEIACAVANTGRFKWKPDFSAEKCEVKIESAHNPAIKAQSGLFRPVEPN